MTATASAPDGRHAWLVAGVATVAMVVTFGTPFSFGVFLVHFEPEYGISAVALSTVFAVQLFAFYAGAGLVGVLATRYPARRLLVACVIAIGALAPAAVVVDRYAGLLAVFAALGVALGTVYVVLAAVVPRWFRERRGLATGVFFSGIGVSLLVMPPIWQLAFVRLGVDRGLLAVLVATALLCLPAAVLCRRPPWADRPSTGSNTASWLVELAAGREFRLQFLGVGLALGWYSLLAAYAVELFAARGLGEAAAAAAFGAVGGVSVLSRLASGAVADRAGPRRPFLAALGCVVVGSLLLAIPSLATTALAVVCFGVGFGGVAALYIPLVLRSYAPERGVAVVGVFNVAFGAFALGLPPVGRALIAATGSYLGAVALTGLAALAAFVCIARTS